jgi:predicted AAA+ superfamily ATPase
LEQKSGGDLETFSDRLAAAIHAKDGQTISDIFRDLFSKLNFSQSQANLKNFHSLVQIILTALGFNVLSGVPGNKGRMDLCVFLPDEIYLIIEVKYYPSTKKLTKKEENNILATEAIVNLQKNLINKAMSRAVKDKLGIAGVKKLFAELPSQPATAAENEIILVNAAEKVLTDDEMAKALAKLARKEIPQDKLSEILLDIQADSDLCEEEIDALLSEGAQEALSQILKQDYSSILRINAKEVMELGLAIFGSGSHVKAAFRQKPSEDLQQSR